MSYRIRLTLIFLLVFFLVISVAPFVIAVPELENIVPTNELVTNDSLFIDVDGETIHYQRHDSPDSAITFVLLHGFGSNLQMWTPLVDELSAYGNVIRADQIGFGLSDKPVRGTWQHSGEGVNPYTNQGQIVMLRGLLDALEVTNPVLVGHASGATLALTYALAYPDAIDGLILLAPTAYSQGGAPAWIRPLMLTPQFNRVGVLPMRQFAGEAGQALYESMWAYPENISEEARARHTITTKTENWDRAMWEYTRFAQPASFEAGELEQLQQPSLILAGDSDKLIPQEESETLAEVLQGELVTLEGCGHLSPEECPQKILDAVTSWASTKLATEIP